MTKDQFMIELAGLLSNIPQEERKDALNFYEDYFADAGIQGDMEVPLSVGTPKQAADSIISDAISRNYEQSDVVNDNISNTTADGDYRKDTNSNTNNYNNTACRQPYSNQNNKENLLLVILLIVITAPIWFIILSVVAGVLFGILAALGGMILGFVIAGIALIITAFMSSTVASGIFLAGIGLILLAVAMLLFIPLILYCVKFLPWLMKEIIKLVKGLFGKGAQAA